MTLVDEIDEYARELQRDRSAAVQYHRDSIGLLKQYLSNRTGTFTHLTEPILRDFLSRWSMEQGSGAGGQGSGIGGQGSEAGGRGDSNLGPSLLLESMASFLEWLERHGQTVPDPECAALLEELSTTLPRAIEITSALSKHLAIRGGAFSFPEFLTTFADGGQSQYDIDTAGEGGGPGAIEGYFKVVRVEGLSVEVEEIISEERAWPLLVPAEIGPLIEPGYILNLEIIRSAEGWIIAACGFAYPPGTEI